jgi:hypothetical protein
VSETQLDRLPSATTEHLEKYPLTLATLPSVATSMVAGVNWYENFDDPQEMKIRGRTRWVIGYGSLRGIRGGHAICLRNQQIRDSPHWWAFYDQEAEGRCVEYAVNRVMTHANRRRYDITSRWLYWQAQRLDEWPGGSYPGADPQYEGTSVRAGLEVARTLGMLRSRPYGETISPDESDKLVRYGDGVAAYRWATTWDMVRTALNIPDWLPGVPVNNSWGLSYPAEVVLLDEVGERLLNEDGEFGIVTDR